MKIVAVLLALLTAGAGYGAWFFRERATGSEARLADEQGQTAALRKDVDRLKAAVKDAEAARTEVEGRASSLQEEIARLSAALKEAEAGSADAAARASAFCGILTAYYQLASLLDGRFSPAYRSTLRAQQDFATAPSGERYDSFTNSLATLQAAAADTLKAAGELRALLKSGAATLDAAKFPREGFERIVAKNVASWQAIGKAADATAKSMRRSACAILSNEAWQSADVDVRAGELIAVAATGKWRWGVTLGNAVGPDGENGDPDYRVVRDFGNGALIARIRGSELVHRGAPLIQPDREGKVEFRINDTAVRDNQGTMDVVAWVFLPFRAE